jgi:hypothetical protein
MREGLLRDEGPPENGDLLHQLLVLLLQLTVLLSQLIDRLQRVGGVRGIGRNIRRRLRVGDACRNHQDQTEVQHRSPESLGHDGLLKNTFSARAEYPANGTRRRLAATKIRSLHSHRARRIKVDPKFFGDVGDGKLGFHAVARLIERRREHSDGALARNNGDDAAAYAAFRR